MYILLIALSLMTPLIILVVGLIFYKFPPKDINSFSGYRTTKSMKNLETWKEANKYSTILMIRYSLATLVLTIMSLSIIGRSKAGLAILTVLSSTITTVLLIVMIIQTEKHLKNKFNL